MEPVELGGGGSGCSAGLVDGKDGGGLACLGLGLEVLELVGCGGGERWEARVLPELDRV